MRIYIAGKITGDSNLKVKFATLKEELEQPGDVILNPAELPSGLTAEEYMRLCFAMIDMSDVVIFQSDYIESKGALLELEYCKYANKMYMFRK